jgi:hypothetical protein
MPTPAALVALPAAAAVMLAGAPTTWTTANSVATGDQDAPAIAANRYGQVAVVWEDDRDTTAPGDTAHSDVWLRLFTNGASEYEVRLSAGGTSGTAWRHLSPDVGLDDRGNAVVVWAEDADGNGVFNISYRVVSTAGAVLASGRANADVAGDQIAPKVGVDPDGAPNSATAVAFTVAWEDVQGSAHTVRAAGFTAAGTKAYEVTASQATGAHRRPDVAVPASGDAVVVWGEDGDADGVEDVGLVRLAKADGAVNLTRRVANGVTAGRQRNPAVAASFSGDFAVAWESDHTGTPSVQTRSFTATGTPRHADVTVAAGAGVAGPAVGVDDRSVAAGDPAVWFRGFGADGSVTGRTPPTLTGQTTTGRQEQLVVAVSPWGEVPLAYTDDSDGNRFDQVLLGFGATGSDW